MRKRLAVTIGTLLTMAMMSRAAQAPANLLPQAQAADVLSDLINWSADRATARADSMRQFLKEIDQFDAFTHAPAPASAPTAGPATVPVFYDQTFAGAVRFVEQGGDQYADPALKKLNATQLMQELSAVASYNIKEFEYLNQQRALIAAMKNYLKSIDKLQAYTTWAADRTPDLKTSPPQSGATPLSQGQSPADRVAQTEAMMQSARAAALKRAEAAGISPSEFDSQWDQKQAKLREDVSKRLEGMSDLAAAFSKMASAKPTPLGTSPDGAARQEIARPWEPFGDPFNTTYQGAGIYRSFDTRVNIDNDQRVNGEYDRRANLGFDRRLNIRISQRQGV